MTERERIKSKHRNKVSTVKEKKKVRYSYYLSKILITFILTLITLILLKQNENWKKAFHKHVFEKNFSFASINKMYEEKFGAALPFKDLLSSGTETVFEEKLSYKDTNKYLDGVKLTVSTEYLVPALETGMVVFVGEKEKYGKCIIIEGTDGVEIWYGNMNKSDVKVYDFIEKGSYLGQTSKNTLYLVFKKDGKVLDYTKYIS